MVDVMLHIAGALGMQIVFTMLLHFLGVPDWVGVVIGGILSAAFWTGREVWQASGRQTRDGLDPHDWPAVWHRTHHVEWWAPTVANVVASVAFCVYTAGPAKAQPQPSQCGPIALVEETLRSNHKERKVAQLLLGNGVPASIFANTTTGTYTFLIYPPDPPGFACVAGSGEGFKTVVIPREDTI